MRAFVAAIVLIAVSACGGASDESKRTNPPAATAEPGTGIALRDTAFVPERITGRPGATFTWTNEDDVPHTVTSDQGLFDRRLAAGETFTHTFANDGTFTYYCRIHGSSVMAGRVVVK